MAQGEGIGLPLERQRASGRLNLVWQTPYEVILDAVVADLLERVRARPVKRLFVDGLDALSSAAAYPRRTQTVLAALSNELRALDVTTVLSFEAPLLGGSGAIEIQGTPAALVENALLLRYVELRSSLHRLISVLKVRGSEYDPRIREFHISEDGIAIASTFESAENVLSGLAHVRCDA